MHFKIDWASLIVGRKFTVFTLFYFVFEGNSKYKPPGSLYLEGRFNGGIFCIMSLVGLYLEGLIHGGALFSEFYGMFVILNMISVENGVLMVLGAF